MKITKTIPAVVVGFAALLAVAAATRLPLRQVLLFLAGRSACPYRRTVESVGESHQQTAWQQRIARTSRVIKKDGKLQHWATLAGTFWVPIHDEELPFILAEEERKVYGSGAQGVQPGDVVLDCGAHVGTYTRRALAARARLVVAIEPEPLNIECLRRNLADEIRQGRVVVYPKGLWDREDRLSFQSSPINTGLGRFEQGGRSDEKLPVTTMDSLVVELRLARVDFVKMDIEGAERRALAGGKQTLNKHRPRLAIASYHLPDDLRVLPEVVKSAWAGYHTDCGPCVEREGHIIPTVLYFRPD